MLSLQDPSQSNLHLEKLAKENWLFLRHAEESFFRQRSCIKWLAEGDFNTSFFHKVMKARNVYNSVNPVLSRPSGVSREPSPTDLLRDSPGDAFCSLYRGNIKKSLSGMPTNKTPGPDGFPAEFFRAAWSIMGPEILLAIKRFFEAPFMPKALNSTFLVLLQKRPGADQLKDYRPISCLNTLYKLITRLIADKSFSCLS
ncbi:unnamed protein product [Microthlaspi erraticum]|uniref:Reverse transcriptase domain-containing protein n=1 Tax=Microthlaspi erraticum TaxID=1685480 RepID=A0A6D2IG70_9BRAS|nr:unnamed protein product [Microthlaspi erraticum]